jgi:hypothetical protein
MRALFDRLKQKYVAALDRMPQMGGHFSVSHSAVARAESSSAVAAQSVPGPAATVRTIATDRASLLAR